MPKRPRIETVLAYWTVDAATWRQFIRDVRAYQQQPGAVRCALELQDDFPASGMEVTVREHEVRIGGETFDFRYVADVKVVLRAAWLEFGGDPDGAPKYIVAVPVPGHARDEAARVADHFTHQAAELIRISAEERARPTLSNRLLNVVEGHFVLVTLLFFFVGIPALVFFLHLLSQWFPSFRLMRDE
ncbi:MAG: hypothetical protein K0Q72_871 [Armatimonadetes bacterium]|jgi:hypothetical protein|nr:hypothetical protein [Armatimonadota bacterium]